jgi:hypothetical protein
LDIYIHWSRSNHHVTELTATQNHSQYRREQSNQFFQETSDFISGSLSNFFKQNGVDRRDLMENLVEEATSRAEQVLEEFNLGAEFTPGLIKLSFYDFLILCGRCPHLHLLSH